jgi:hypothetical protein
MTLASYGHLRATPFPGPDDFGYGAVTVPSNLRDISSTGTFVPLSDDEVSTAIPLPFAFNFYGVAYNEIFISSNGFISFTPQSNGCCSGQPLPAPDGINNLIAGFWEDLNNPQGNIRYQTLGAAPNRQFVIGFYNNPHYFAGPPVTFEIILHEGSDNIELQYGSAPSDGGQHSVGIENLDGTIGLEIAFGNVSFSNEGFLISKHLNATIAAVDTNSCPVTAQVAISDSEGHPLSGAINIYEASNAYPSGLSEIRLELLHTACGATPTFNFSLGGNVIDAFAETVPQPGQPAPGFCNCTPGVETRIYDTPGVLALWDPAGGALNQFRIDRATAGCCDVALSWARVALSGPGQPTRSYCLFDQSGGDCTQTDLCITDFTWDSTQAEQLIPSALTLALSENYENSSLPGCIDLSNVQSSTVALEVVATDGLFTASDFVDGVDRGACNFLSINNAPCNEPPSCAAAVASPARIWPPNHKFVPINITGVTDPDGDPITITATAISQDEVVRESGLGSGNTAPDATLTPLAVRAERHGNPKSPGNGRVYHVSFVADDGRGGQCTGAVQVCVPHDQGKGSACVDGGPLYNSLAP